MLTETIQYKITDLDLTTKSISIARDTVVMKDGAEIARNRHRCAFVPGDIEAVKEYMGVTESAEIDYLNAIWTQEAIDAHQAKQGEF